MPNDTTGKLYYWTRDDLAAIRRIREDLHFMNDAQAVRHAIHAAADTLKIRRKKTSRNSENGT